VTTREKQDDVGRGEALLLKFFFGSCSQLSSLHLLPTFVSAVSEKCNAAYVLEMPGLFVLPFLRILFVLRPFHQIHLVP